MNKFIIAEDLIKIIINIISVAKHPDASNALNLVSNLEKVKDDTN